MVQNIGTKRIFKVGRSGQRNRIVFSRKGSVMKRVSVTLLALAFGLYCDLANATLINVDFGPGAADYIMTGAGLIGSAGDTWNVTGQYSSSGTFALVDSANSSAGVTMTTSGGLFEGTATAPGFTIATDSPYYNLVYDNIVITTGSPFSATLSNLAAGTYNLYFYAVPPGDGQDRVGTYSANGLSTSIGANNNATSMTNGVNYGVLQNVTVGSDHLLTISVVATGGGETDFNGFQLQSVPEPSSLILLGVGLCSLLAYAWRKRK